MAPIFAALANYGLRLVANAAMVKGKEFIEDKTGVRLDEQQENLSNEDRQKLQQFQLEHEEELLRLQLENNKLALEETKAYLADVEDARKVHAGVLVSSTAPWYAKAIQPALAATVVVGTIVLFMLFVIWSGETYMLDAQGHYILDQKTGQPMTMKTMSQTQKDIVIYVLGVLSAAVTQILGYYFGSSQSSAKKTDMLDNVLKKSAD